MKAVQCVVVTLCSLCCCALLVAISLAAAAAYFVGPAFDAAAEVMICVNETMNDGSSSFYGMDSQAGPCHELQHIDCDVEEGLDPDPKCEKLQSECVCSVVTHLSERRNPTLEVGLDKCCSKLEGIEDKLQEKLTMVNVSEVIERYLGKNSVEACHEVVENVSNTVNDLAHQCANGDMDGTADLRAKADISSVITADKFEDLTSLITSIEATHSRIPLTLPLVGSAAVVGALLMAVAFRLRRRVTQVSEMPLELGFRSQHAINSDEECFIE